MIVAATFVGCEIGVGTDAEGDSQSEPERTSPGDGSHSARPSNIPIPDSPNYSFPDVTNEIEVSRIPQEDLANFEPMLTEEPATEPINSIPFGYVFSPQRVVLIDDADIPDQVSVVYKKLGTSCLTQVTLFEYVGANGHPWAAAQFSFEAPIRFSNQTGKDLVTTNDRFYRE